MVRPGSPLAAKGLEEGERLSRRWSPVGGDDCGRPGAAGAEHNRHDSRDKEEYDGRASRSRHHCLHRRADRHGARWARAVVGSLHRRARPRSMCGHRHDLTVRRGRHHDLMQRDNKRHDQSRAGKYRAKMCCSDAKALHHKGSCRKTSAASQQIGETGCPISPLCTTCYFSTG